MSVSVGIGLAFVAMLCWGIGDFLIQKSTRRFGDFETIFLITGFGALVLLPFVYKDLPTLFNGETHTVLWILLGTGALHLFAALLELESLKRGKIAVMEPLWSLEIPAAGLFAFWLLGERMTLLEIGIIASLIVGLFLVSFAGYPAAPLRGNENEGRGSGKREFPRGGEQRASRRARVENREVLKKLPSPNTPSACCGDGTREVLFRGRILSRRHFLERGVYFAIGERS